MLTKTCPAKVKAVGDGEGLADGQFRALVSVFGNKDSYGDIVQPGAFTDTLAEWAAKGDPIPVYWSHRMDDPDFNIGQVVTAEETTEGLVVLAQLDLDEPKAKQVYRLLKGRRVTQFSFAYDVVEGAWVETQDDSHYELRKLALYEVGPTPIGANDQTELLGVKHATEHLVHRAAVDLRAGRQVSPKSRTSLSDALTSLEESATQIKTVLAVLDMDEAQVQEKAITNGPANDEEPQGAKSEEPSRRVPVDVLAAEISLLALET